MVKRSWYTDQRALALCRPHKVCENCARWGVLGWVENVDIAREHYLKTYIAALATFAGALCVSWGYRYGLDFEPVLVVGALVFGRAAGCIRPSPR